jgi:hypothetical protein
MMRSTRRRVRVPVGAAACLLVVGCVTTPPQTFEHTPPAHDIETERVTAEPLPKIWGRVVRRLDKAEFRIDLVDPETHTVEASSSLDLAEGLVDCGSSVWTHTQGERTREYAFGGLDTANYPHHDGAQVWHMVRGPDELSGSVSLHLEETDDGTRVVVEARFALEHVVQRKSGGRVAETRRYVDRFTSREPSQPQDPHDPVCASTGKLEERAFDFALASEWSPPSPQ